MKKIICLLAVVTLSGCNLWAPFDGGSSSQDYLEKATKCLDDGDFSCAISNYSSLPNGDFRNKKLCMAYLAKTGVTLNVLLNIVTEKSDNMLGSLAQALVPWDETKASDAVSGLTSCQAYFATNSTDSTAALLDTMGLLTDCSIRIAKTDQFLAMSNGGACNVPSTSNDGLITQSDIQAGSNLAPFMCEADVQACNVDVQAIPSSVLSQAGLGDLHDAIGLIPPGLAASGPATTAARDAIVQAIAN